MPAKVDHEVWRNTTRGMRWYTVVNARGMEESKIVRGNRTFTIAVEDRQLNQDRAGSPAQDLFRNGTFILMKAAPSTDVEEFKSADSMTDEEVDDFVRELMYGERTDADVRAILGEVTSANTLSRVMASMVIEDADDRLMKLAKDHMDVLAPPVPETRQVVITKPGDDD